jgi:hypothetical protein
MGGDYNRNGCLPVERVSRPNIFVLYYNVVGAVLPAYRQAGVAALNWEPTEGLPFSN